MTTKPKIPKAIWMLGFVSMFADISTEMVQAILPLFMLETLGASIALIGLIDGVAEIVSSIAKIYAGYISDFFAKRKYLAAFGYGLSALSKLLFPFITRAEMVMGAKTIDRIGKGIRGAPRDALIADVAPTEIEGACFGLRQAMDTIGAFLGPIIALILLYYWPNDFNLIFWVAILPAFASPLILIFIPETERAKIPSKKKAALDWGNLAALGKDYWLIVFMAILFALPKFSDGFLILRANEMHIKNQYIPLVYIILNIVYAAFAYPIGAISDKIGKYGILAFGMIFLIIAHLSFAFGTNWQVFGIGLICWGLYLAFTQGAFSTFIAQHAPPELRGTSFGFFYLANGFALLASSGFGGLIWQKMGSQNAFLCGAINGLISLLIWLIFARRFKES